MALNVISNFAANVAHRYLSESDAAAKLDMTLRAIVSSYLDQADQVEGVALAGFECENLSEVVERLGELSLILGREAGP